MNFKVVETVDDPNGKWAEQLGNVIAIDSRYLLKEYYESLIYNLENIDANITQA